MICRTRVFRGQSDRVVKASGVVEIPCAFTEIKGIRGGILERREKETADASVLQFLYAVAIECGCEMLSPVRGGDEKFVEIKARPLCIGAKMSEEGTCDFAVREDHIAVETGRCEDLTE